jgi:site-specific DNA-methyltransferase (adenine-specific)
VSLTYHIGDTLELARKLPDASVDLIVTSPPFLALRSYLPADHPDKHREIGSEATPADFLDTLLGLTGEWLRVLAPHGSICVELGDTYAGSGGAGGDYTNPDGLRAGQEVFSGSASRRGSTGWPLAKSLTGIPTLYTWSLAYGRNLLNGNPAPQLRIRNVIVWARPNPPVGALGDKFRPATSYITVACKGPKRYFDLDAVRTEHTTKPQRRFVTPTGTVSNQPRQHMSDAYLSDEPTTYGNPAGAPPLDWHADDHPEDGDWLWKMSTQPYRGSHYATFPLTLPKRLIEAMCPLKVCTVCGAPSTRVVGKTEAYEAFRQSKLAQIADLATTERDQAIRPTGFTNAGKAMNSEHVTLGWTDCGHDAWRTGIVLDPFAGSGTTLDAAQAVGRHAIGFDLDDRNADLARERVGMFLEIVA